MKGRPERLLADMIRDPKSWAAPYRSSVLNPDPLREFEKIVLDAEAVTMVTRLSQLPPRDMVKMLDMALPPFDKLWVEWPTKPFMDARRQHAQEKGDPYDTFEGHTEQDRCGIRITRYDEHYLSVHCTETGHDGKVMEWPIGYRMSLDPDHPLRMQDFSDEKFATRKGKVDIMQQTASLWGYRKETPGLSALKHRAFASILPQYKEMADDQHLVQYTLSELAGLTRLTVSLLAMLNTKVVSVAPSHRPKGRYLSGTKTLPYTERRVAVLDIPARISRRYEYVRKEIRDEGNRIRHRKHKVAAHYRHSDHLPLNGHGWVRCTCSDRPAGMWHKEIHEHYRGDESLGVIEREFTMVRGHINAVSKLSN